MHADIIERHADTCGSYLKVTFENTTLENMAAHATAAVASRPSREAFSLLSSDSDDLSSEPVSE